MIKSKKYKEIPTALTEDQFNEFICEHLTSGARGPSTKLPFFKIFNYILKILHMGCQWKTLPIEKAEDGKPEIHYTSVYRQFRRWEKDGCFNLIFCHSVQALHDNGKLDTTVIHGDGTSAAAKKGATILAEMVINISLVIKLWLFVIEMQMYLRHLSRHLVIVMNLLYFQRRCNHWRKHLKQSVLQWISVSWV